MAGCAHCGEPAITNLDNDDLCKRHADEWVRGEGRATDYDEQERLHAMDNANYAQDRPSLGVPASSMNGNATQRHKDPDAWDRWVRFSEGWGI